MQHKAVTVIADFAVYTQYVSMENCFCLEETLQITGRRAETHIIKEINSTGIRTTETESEKFAPDHTCVEPERRHAADVALWFMYFKVTAF